MAWISLYHGRAIWERAWSYLNPLPFNSDVTRDPPDPLRVWDCPDAPEEAPPTHKQALRLLRNLISTNDNRPRPTLTNNFSVKDVMDNYVYDVIDAILQVRDTSLILARPLNTRIQMRYVNTAPAVFDEKQPFRNLPFTPNTLLSIEEVGMEVFYPNFSRVVLKHHQAASNNASGYTDKILVSSPISQPENRCASSEAKTPWSYQTVDFESILKGHDYIVDQQNMFQKEDDYLPHSGNTLSKQVRAFHDSDICISNLPNVPP